MMPIDLVLVRHGQSEGNLANRRAEKGDLSAFTADFKDRHSSMFRLSELGRQQAVVVGNYIKSTFYGSFMSGGFDRHITSEYVRAMETAALMKLPNNARWYRDVYLTERNWGEMEVCSIQEREERFGDALRQRKAEPFFWKPPNGESFLELCLRVDRVLNTLHRECSDKRVIIVCHGEVMRAFQVRLERMSQDRFRELTFSKNLEDGIYNCQVIHYTRRDPVSKKLGKYANWVQSHRVNAEGIPWTSEWKTIVRPTYSNDDLMSAVSKTPAIIS